jgi:hypothetical protein
MKIKNQKIATISGPILLGLFCFFIFPQNASAQGTTLKISPSLLKIEAKPPADIWSSFSIENQSDQPVNLTIGYKPFDQLASKNGNVVFLQDGLQVPGLDKKIFEKIQIVNDENISQNTISIGPRQREKLRLRIMLPANEPTSDYYFSLVFLQSTNQTNQNTSNGVNKSQESISSIQTGIGMNVLLAIGDKETPQATIDTFTTPWFNQNGPVPFNLTVFNNGVHFIAPKGAIFIKNMFGQTIGKISIPSTVILAGTSRTLAGKGVQLNANSLANSILNNNQQNLGFIVWPEHFLFGMYTATLSLSLSDNGPVYERSITFFAFPLNYLLGLLLLLALLFYSYRRVKKKLF